MIDPAHAAQAVKEIFTPIGAAVGFVHATYRAVMAYRKAKTDKDRTLSVAVERTSAGTFELELTFRPGEMHDAPALTARVLDPPDVRIIAKPGSRASAGGGEWRYADDLYERAGAVAEPTVVNHGGHWWSSLTVVSREAVLLSCRLEVRLTSIATGRRLLKRTVTISNPI